MSQLQRREIDVSYNLSANTSQYVTIPTVEGCLCVSCCLILDVTSDGSPRLSSPMRQAKGVWNTRITTGGACTIRGRIICYYLPA